MNNLSASSSGKEETAKVLLMGRAGAGKTSMRSIIFANYLARETTRLHPTNQVEHSHLRFLGNMTLSLWDCGGQDVFMENYFESQKDHIFRNVRVMIYVVALAGNDQRDAEQQKEITYFKNSMESLRSLSKSAHVYVLLHKFDLVPENEREARFKYYSELLSPYFAGMTTQIFQTSIWDETLYRAWSEIAHSLIPNMDELQRELANFASAVEADEVVLFEKSTFLVIANHTTKQMADPHRFEKISNIVKQFKLSVNKHHAALQLFGRLQLQLSGHIDRFTPNTFVMVVTSDPNIHPAATTCNINAARSHFLAVRPCTDSYV
ncbi:t24f1.1 protein, putative [Perkinsus marinus ATCC 50983]|uniref:T24f1.1 protein, putative n=1 Tax=Perkinsus marinus (strain ATCC 50983 / TXsc) TaxID=423536 RepID=C5LY76_PERM5|nr:t24f1.1 protein, putative [Perkinsus marinus ATCC 50983]EEQ98406.1 t24f1.1 protein, putative [Perkinsus marinus ATCC 50983]|eukprot:XP_002765689.1 t24f1.1 protein, putative [Perkinsus marinus ATCC 50983]